MIDQPEPFNYLTSANGAALVACSSNISSCPGSNVLNPDRKQIWLSEAGIPQQITFDISKLSIRPKFFKCFGFDCWHDYSSNPAVIELQASTDGGNFVNWAVLYPELRPGLQIFNIDPLPRSYNFLKLIIKETHGAVKTYLNQVFLFEESPIKSAKPVSLNTTFEESQVLDTAGGNPLRKEHPTPTPQGILKNSRYAGSTNVTPTQGTKLAASTNRSTTSFNIAQEQKQSTRRHKPNSQSMPKLNDLPDWGLEEKSPEQETPAPKSTVKSPHLKTDFSENFLTQPAFSSQTKPSPASNELARLLAQPLKLPESKSFINDNNSNIFGGQVFEDTGMSFKFNNALNAQQPNPGDTFSGNLNLKNFGNDLGKLLPSISLSGNKPPSQKQNYSAVIEEREINLPLTQTEKEVKKIKQDMGVWIDSIGAMDNSIKKLADKLEGISQAVNMFQEYIHETKKEEHSAFKDKFQESINYHKHSDVKSQSVNYNNAASIQHQNSQGGNTYYASEMARIECMFESMKAGFEEQLETIRQQNQATLQENKELKKLLKSKRYEQDLNASIGEESYHLSTKGNLPQQMKMPNRQRKEEVVATNLSQYDIEKICERVYKKWEADILTQMRIQTQMAEDKLNQNILNIKLSFENEVAILKKSTEEELHYNKKRIEELEKIVRNQQSTIAFLQSQVASAPLMEKVLVQNNSVSKQKEQESAKQTKKYAGYRPTDSSKYYSEEKVETTKISPINGKYSQQKENFEPKQGLDFSDKRDPQQTNKIMLLMERLQEKMELRDKKLQKLNCDSSRTDQTTDMESYISKHRLDNESFDKKRSHKATKPRSDSSSKFHY